MKTLDLRFARMTGIVCFGVFQGAERNLPIYRKAVELSAGDSWGGERMLKKSLLLLACLALAQVAPAWGGTLSAPGNGTVTDSATGLMWQQGEGGAMTWESALSSCENLILAGYSDWRLPNVKELESLTDDSRYNPAIDVAFFSGAQADYYWSATTSHADGTLYAWRVQFYNGYVSSASKGAIYYVRCVR